MNNKKLYSRVEISEILNKSQSWVCNTIKENFILPEEIMSGKGTRARDKFLFSYEQILELEKLIFRRYGKRKRKAKKVTSQQPTNLFLENLEQKADLEYQKQITGLNAKFNFMQETYKTREEILHICFKHQAYCSIAMLDDLATLFERGK